MTQNVILPPKINEELRQFVPEWYQWDIIDAMEKQKQVKIQYHQEALTWFRSESDDYFLDDIQIIN